MIKFPALHLPLSDWLLEGPLSSQVPAYMARLKRGSYASHTCERNLNALAHFGVQLQSLASGSYMHLQLRLKSIGPPLWEGESAQSRARVWRLSQTVIWRTNHHPTTPTISALLGEFSVMGNRSRARAATPGQGCALWLPGAWFATMGR